MTVSVTRSPLWPRLYEHKILRRLKGEEGYGASISQISVLYSCFKNPGVSCRHLKKQLKYRKLPFVCDSFTEGIANVSDVTMFASCCF